MENVPQQLPLSPYDEGYHYGFRKLFRLKPLGTEDATIHPSLFERTDFLEGVGEGVIHAKQLRGSLEREKNSTVSALAESGFIPEGAIGKTVGLSYRMEANL